MAEDSRSHNVEYVAFDSWHVVIDTSAILGTGSRKDADFRLSRPATRTFLQTVQPPLFYLSIPLVVIIEMANHYREEMSSARDRLDTALRDVGHLLGRQVSSDMPTDEADAQASTYEQWLIQELAKYGARIEALPEDLRGAEELIRDELFGHKPFGERRRGGGNRGERSGMRDAMIWASVLALCKRERRSLAFITGNTQDFADDSNLRLHADLLHDFEEIRTERQEVRFYRSIKDFADDPPTAFGSNSPEADVLAPADASLPSIDDTSP